MRKILALIAASVMALSLAGCSSDSGTVISYDEDKTVKTVKEYDESGRLLTETGYFKGLTDWNFAMLTTFTYENGVLVASDTYATDAEVEKESVTEVFKIKESQYHSNGTVSREVYYNNDSDAPYVSSVCEYDEKGELISEVNYNEKGEVIE